MEESRQYKIERLAGEGALMELRELLGTNFTQLEIDIALESSIAYSQIKTAEYLLSLGAIFSNYDYQGVYYAVHNNELEGLKFSILNGVDINVNNGMLLNTSIITSTNTKNIEIVKWLLDNGADLRYLTEESLKVVNNYGTEELKHLIRSAT
jgi:hypothetical protein